MPPSLRAWARDQDFGEPGAVGNVDELEARPKRKDYERELGDKVNGYPHGVISEVSLRRMKVPVTAHRSQRLKRAVGNRRKRISAWQDRFRDPGLTVLLVLELCLVFLAAPLAAKGLPAARSIVETMVLAVLVLVVMLSHRRGAIVIILLGLAATLAGVAVGSEWPSVTSRVLRRGGNMLTFVALSWVVSHAVYAPGRITFHRLQGAVVLYLNLATIFALGFSLIWELSPGAFANLPTATGGPGELATMLYFSLVTLTTTGYGDILPVDPLARSLANTESVLGQFYLAITVARLVTLELADRRR
jgi:Ion channel